ncbi:MAG TPA: hypothetical protein DCW83_13245 [Saprospirales bacterium]|nr:hypothetical protein [Saprospirales bacterium]
MQKDIKLIVPDSLHEIELGQYQTYLALIENLDATEDAEQINRKLIETFCGLKPEQVNLLPLTSVESLLKVLSGAFSEEFELIRHFELDGVKFGFIPKLDDMSLGEYIDLESTFGDWEKMHKAMAILYRVVNFEKGEKYDIVSYETNEELAEAMKMMPLSVVMSCMVFFYSLGTELAQATLSYTQKVVKESSTTSQVREALELNGVGINQFTDSLKAMSEDLMKLQPYRSTNV